MTIAICREVSPALAQCELTHIERSPINVQEAQAQHAAYEKTLENLGLTVISLPAEPDLPDSVFVEDTALVLDEVAVMLCPGAVSRRPEVPSIARTLQEYRPLVFMKEPATVDGGDILRLGKTLYVGLSTRSDVAGIAALEALVRPYGYDVRAVRLSGCLHLKSAATLLTRDTVLANPAWVDPQVFEGTSFLAIHPDEPHAGNVLRLENSVIYPTAFPRTLERMTKLVSDIHCVDLSELAKAEGAVTCCSLIV